MVAEAGPDLQPDESGVGLGQPLSGSIRIDPLFVLTGVLERTIEVSGDGSGRHYYIGSLESDRLAEVTFAPLKEYRQRTVVSIRSVRGYQEEPSILGTRRFARFVEAHPGSLVPPVILSGRDTWVWKPRASALGELHAYDSAAIVDGRQRVGGFALAAREGNVRRLVDFVLLPELTIEEERELHEALRQGRTLEADLAAEPSATRLPVQDRAILKVSTEWRLLEILSEPYVFNGRRGYAPMLDVRDEWSAERLGMYVGAKSLSRALEELREVKGSLLGLRIYIRKESDDQYSRYQVELASPND